MYSGGDLFGILSKVTKKCDAYDILILGGGLGGLTCAALLSHSSDLRIALLEKKSLGELEDFSSDQRTTAISYGSKRVYEEAGLWTSEISQAEILDIVVTDGSTNAFMHYNHEDIHISSMGYNVTNSSLKKLLFKRVKQKVTIIPSYDYKEIAWSGHDVKLLGNTSVSGKLLIIAEGANSRMRSMCNISVFCHEYGQSALSFKITHTNNHDNVAVEKFLPMGPLAVLPAYGGFESAIILTGARDNVDALLMMHKNNKELFEEYLNKQLGEGNPLGKISVPHGISAYPLSIKIAKKLFHNRAVLVGDSAHSIHPVAGQGFNLSIRGIKLLSDMIKYSHNIGLDIGSQTFLSQYQRARLPDIINMALSTDGVVKLFGSSIPIVKMVRSLGMGIIQKSSLLKRRLIRRATGLIW